MADSADLRAKAESDERRGVRELQAKCGHELQVYVPANGKKVGAWHCSDCGAKL